MATTVTERLLSADEFARLPDPCDGSRMELIEGRVVMAPPAGFEHMDLSSEVALCLRTFARAKSLGSGFGEGGFRLSSDPDVVRAPDAAFISAARIAGQSGRTGYFEGAPDLAVEVVSPNDREGDVLRKVGEYLDAGAARVWVVRPVTNTVSVYVAGGDVSTLRSGDTLTSEHAGFSVEGFALPLDELFA